jgi:hypothetical protein
MKAVAKTAITEPRLRTLVPDPRWAGKIHYKDEDMFASEVELEDQAESVPKPKKPAAESGKES